MEFLTLYIVLPARLAYRSSFELRINPGRRKKKPIVSAFENDGRVFSETLRGLEKAQFGLELQTRSAISMVRTARVSAIAYDFNEIYLLMRTQFRSNTYLQGQARDVGHIPDNFPLYFVANHSLVLYA